MSVLIEAPPDSAAADGDGATSEEASADAAAPAVADGEREGGGEQAADEGGGWEEFEEGEEEEMYERGDEGEGDEEVLDWQLTDEEQRKTPATPPRSPRLVPEGPITTIMLRHISVHMTRPKLLKRLDALGFKGRYDFVHMPMNFGSKLNKRLAFINFVDEVSCRSFLEDLEKGHGVSSWTAQLADIQGLEANATAASSRNVCRIRNKANKPLILAPLPEHLQKIEATPMPLPTEPNAPEEELSEPEPNTPARKRFGRWCRHVRVAEAAEAAAAAAQGPLE